MKVLPILALPLLAVAALSELANAHHSFSMFDRSREIVMEANVVRWGFNSPHVLLYVEDDEGTQWGLEGSAPPRLLELDPPMTGFTLQPGDRVTLVYCPLRDGRPGGAIGLLITADGTLYDPSDGGCAAEQRIEEWPDWIEMGYRSRAEAEDALGIGSDDED